MNRIQTFGVVITPLTDDISKKALSENFSKFGKIINISINKNKNCSYVNYERKDSSIRAAEEMSGQYIGDTKIKAEAQNKKNSNPKTNNPCVRISGFNQNVTETYLSKVFHTLPGFKSVFIPKGKTFGFVNFNTEDEATSAFNEINGKQFDNFTIEASRRQNPLTKPPNFQTEREKVTMPIHNTKSDNVMLPKSDESNSKKEEFSVDQMIVSFIENFLKTKYYNNFDQFCSFYCKQPIFTLSESYLNNGLKQTIEENEKQTAHSPIDIIEILRNSLFGSLFCSFDSLNVSQIGEYSFSVMLNGHFKDIQTMEVFRVMTIFYSFEDSQFKISSDHIHIKFFVPNAM